MYWYQRPNNTISKVYNDGIAIFYTKQQAKDKYDTPIPDGDILTEVRQQWWRRLGTTSEEVYQSSSLGTKVSKRIAVKGHGFLDSKMEVVIDAKLYTIYRLYENPYSDETEISLVEVK